MHPLAAALLDLPPEVGGLTPVDTSPTQPRVPERNPSSNVIPLHGTTTPRAEILKEKPLHRVMAYMIARGMTQIEVANATGYSREQVNLIANQVWFRDIVAKVIHEAQADGLMELLRAGAVDAVETLKTLVVSAKSETVRLGAATSLLDRILGKAKPMEDGDKDRVPIDPTSELDQINSELQRLENK